VNQHVLVLLDIGTKVRDEVQSWLLARFELTARLLYMSRVQSRFATARLLNEYSFQRDLSVSRGWLEEMSSYAKQRGMSTSLLVVHFVSSTFVGANRSNDRISIRPEWAESEPFTRLRFSRDGGSIPSLVFFGLKPSTAAYRRPPLLVPANTHSAAPSPRTLQPPILSGSLQWNRS
jgi:hypothetical protein